MLDFLNYMVSVWGSVLNSDLWSIYIIPIIALCFIVAIIELIGEIIWR